MGRPPKFTRQQLQAAALKIVDEHGAGGLSMRALAGSLGTGAMTLYNYVAEREELDLLVIEAVMAEASWSPAPAGTAWEDEVRAIAMAMWQVGRRHPHVIPLILTRRSRSPAMLAVTETLLAALARSGRSGQALLHAFRATSALLMGMAQAELAGPLAVWASESAQDTIARFQALPPEQFPHLIDIATAAARSDALAEFHASLDLLLAGLRQPPQ